MIVLNNAVINQVAILFLIMGIGVIARKKKILKDEVKKGVTDLILNISLPCMIISSFNQEFSVDMLFNAASILIFSIGTHIASYSIGKILYFKSSADRKNILRYFTVFSNAGFMGYPVLEALYGRTGIFYASIYAIPARVFMWTLGIMLFTKKKEPNYLKQIFLNPGIIAVGIGVIPLLLSTKFPVVISQTLNIMGNMTTPLSMLVVGAMLADADIKDIIDGEVFYGSFIRLIMIPVATLIVLKSLGVSGEVLGTTVVLTAMPAGTFTAILAGKFNANEMFASNCVFVTTVLSIITIPFIILLI
jgi:malate permease and related proteins